MIFLYQLAQARPHNVLVYTDVVDLIKIGVYIHGLAYFLWVPIILHQTFDDLKQEEAKIQLLAPKMDGMT